MTTGPDYYRVLGHMDEWLSKDKLFIEHKLNTRCGKLAKAAVNVWIARKLAGTMPNHTQLIPDESAVLLGNDIKVTKEISEAVHFAVGKKEARQFLTAQNDWSNT